MRICENLCPKFTLMKILRYSKMTINTRQKSRQYENPILNVYNSSTIAATSFCSCSNKVSHQSPNSFVLILVCKILVKLCDGKFVGPDGIVRWMGTVIIQPNFWSLRNVHDLPPFGIWIWHLQTDWGKRTIADLGLQKLFNFFWMNSEYFFHTWAIKTSEFLLYP